MQLAIFGSNYFDGERRLSTTDNFNLNFTKNYKKTDIFLGRFFCWLFFACLVCFL